MYSVLVYPNITSPHNALERDSYVIAVGQLVRALNAVRDDLEFTFLTPTHVASWDDIPNITQREWSLPTGNNAMRTYFDPDKFRDVIDWKNRSYDIVWCHLPEVALDIKNTLYNGTNERPPIIGYCHWFEVPELVTFAATTLSKNLEGIVAMDSCGVNSDWLRDIVLGHANAKYGDGPFTRALASRMRTMHLGIEGGNVRKALAEPGLLVWNHRVGVKGGYTGWPEMIEALDTVWATRQDFRVMVTMGAGKLEKPWLVDSGITAPGGSAAYRDEYMVALSRAWWGLPRVQCQWSLSVTDGMSVGVPYILPRDFCYPEMFPSDYAGFYDHGIVPAIHDALDADGVTRMEASLESTEAAKALHWSRRVRDWSDQFDRAIATLPVMGDRSTRYADLLDYVRAVETKTARGVASKAELMRYMKWGVGIPWLPYRNRLRADGVAVTADTYGGRP